MTAFPHLFQPLQIGSVTVANRLFVSAHFTQFVEEDPTGFHRWAVYGERARAYYEDRAKGGFGLQIVGQTQVHPQSGTDRPASFVPEVLDRYRAIAEGCHRHGGKVFVQLNQNGREKGSSGPDAWDPVWSPTAMPAAHGEMTKEMDKDDIASMIEGFVTSARLCEEAGMDGVEIHAAHPHLLGVWLVPALNRRTDEYGGSVENRLRIVLEILDAIRNGCGPDFAVGVRINGAWTMPGGQPLEDSIDIAKAIEATGQADFLDVSGWPGIGSIGTPFAGMIPWAEAIKKEVSSIPVFGIGRVVRPEQAEAIVASGAVDMIGMTRASIADPELPEKARTGRAAEVRVCVGAGQGCLMRNGERRPMTCTQNVAVGREGEWGIGTLTQAPVSRKVVVVGGGPAGLEAAIVAATRGHEVVLFEQQDVLGGQINLIARNPRREEFNRVIEWRAGQIERLGVKLQLGTLATADRVLAEQPDAVIVATGSKPRRDGWYPAVPHVDTLPGHDLPNVMTTWDILLGRCDTAGRVAVIDAHGYHHTADAVEYLARHDVSTVVVSATPIFGAELDSHDRPEVMDVLRRAPVELLTSTIAEEIAPGRILVRETFRGERRVIDDVDIVVLATGQRSVGGLADELAGQVELVERIGDALVPRGVEHALFEGQKIGRAM
jgi:2,4-dienoyl-CoA reductase-like NADH-dependent reductase (Old Yellow Enzyme family)/thioredoxin reductase